MKKYIYKITNIINNKLYIGQTNNLNRRKREHFNLSPSIVEEDEKIKILYKAMIKYGPENFIFEKIEDLCEDYNEKEKFWIKELNTLAPNGYNMTEGGDAPPVFHGESHPMAAHTLEDVQKVQNLLLTTTLSTKEIANLSNYNISSIRRINLGELWYDDKLAYPLRKEDTFEYHKERKNNILYDLLNTRLTQKEIAEKYNVSRTTVTAINRGQNYKQDNVDYPIRKQDCHSKAILMIDRNTHEILREFKDAATAKRELGLVNRADSNIRKCANGGTSTAYGYIWKFKD